MKFIKIILLSLFFTVSVNAKLPDFYKAVNVNSITEFEKALKDSQGKNVMFEVRAD